MSVLMRGVNMPKNCEECNFKGECRDYWEKIREAYTRPSWCPLVEVADRKAELEKRVEWLELQMRLVHRTLDKIDRKTEPQTSCKTCRYGEVDEGYVRCAYYSKSDGQTEPQTEYKKWETKPTADLPTENTTCVGVAMALVEDEPQTDIHDLTDCDFCKGRNCKDCEGGKDEPQTDCAWK